MSKRGKLKVPVTSKAMSGPMNHRPGKECRVQRNESNPGQFILWFGARRYAVVDAIHLHETVEFENGQEGY